MRPLVQYTEQVLVCFSPLYLVDLGTIYVLSSCPAMGCIRIGGENLIRRSYQQEIPVPWTEESAWTQYPLQNLATNGRARFFKIDIWHTVQMGVGKDMAASALCLLANAVNLRSIDQRFEVISQEYLSWCRDFKKIKYVNKLDKRTVGGGGKRDEPSASWNKGALTVTIMEFLEFYFEKHQNELLGNEDIRLRFSFAAVRRLNEFMKGLYGNDLWVPSEEAKRIAFAGKEFVKLYVYLAHLSRQRGQPMFSLKPKLHMLHETAVGMELQAAKGSFALNFLCESCSVDEDFVGRLAFLARHVSPRLVSQRSIERYMVQAYLAWD